MRAEVRCCCDAHLIGFLEIDCELEQGRRYEFPLLPDGVNAGPVKLTTGTPLPSLSFECDTYERAAVRGSLIEINVFTVDSHLALKSRDYPIELVRRIPGFIEAPAGGN